VKPPRFRLATLPTPLLPATRVQPAVGGPPLWIKRDDLNGFGTAGNKARALEYLVGDALAGGADTLVTGGGPGSNFCAAAAAAARAAGLGCRILYAGPAKPRHPNVAAAQAAGAEVTFTGRPDREELDEAIPALAAELTEAGRRPYAMPRGGATAVGALGYVEAYRELANQLGDEAVEPGVIVVATGSGGTLAGLLAGRRTESGCRGGGWRIVGATVSRPPADIQDTVAGLVGALVGIGEVPEIVDARGPGFGVPSPEGERAARVGWATEGLVLDSTYTAKAFAVVLDVMASGYDHPIVFWHTGGGNAGGRHPAGRRRPANDAEERSTPCPTPT
jgi:D-cysteine desulfhydrase